MSRRTVVVVVVVVVAVVSGGLVSTISTIFTVACNAHAPVATRSTLNVNKIVLGEPHNVAVALWLPKCTYQVKIHTHTHSQVHAPAI